VFTLARQCVFHAFYQAFELSNDMIASVDIEKIEIVGGGPTGNPLVCR
jgi:hypothetical protein